MAKSFTVFTSSGASEVMIGANPISLKMFVLQLAANIIYSCQSFPVGENQKPQQGPSAILAKYMRIAPHGYLNAFQEQVAFLHEVGATLLRRDLQFSIILSDGYQSISLITDALRAYQNLKTRIVEEGQKEHNEYWGSATDFNTVDWTDNNVALMALVSR